MRALFASPAGTAAFEEGAAAAGRGARWEVQPAIVDASGALEGSDERLQAFDLDREEWDAFTSGIARLAEQQASHPSSPCTSTALRAQHGQKWQPANVRRVLCDSI